MDDSPPIEPVGPTPPAASPQPADPPNQPLPEAPSYPQYPDSDPADKPRKSKMKMVIIAAVIVLLLIAGLAVLSLGGKSTKKVVACADQNCFNSNFQQCSPAAYTYDQEGSKVQYVITGTQGIGCPVSVQYLTAKYLSGADGKKMTCDFDNRVDFQTAAQYVFQHPADYDCSGDLVSLFENPSTP